MSKISQEYDYLFKCIAVGDGGCGKTALTVRFAHGFFQEQYKMTIGVEFAVKLIEIAGYKTKLQIWDTGGQERFSYVRPLYYRGAMGALLVFDLTNRESFEHLANWIDEVRSNIGEIPMVLVGNKSDLPGREVPREECESFSKKFNMYYLESSAKTGDGVTDCFGVLAAMMIGIVPPAELLGGKSAAPQAVPAVQVPISKPVVQPVPQPVAQPLPQVASIPAAKPTIANEYSSGEEVPPVPSPAFHAAEIKTEAVEFSAPPVPEPAARVTPAKIVAPAAANPFIGAATPRPTGIAAPVDEFAAPPIPEPGAEVKKFVSLEKFIDNEAPKAPVVVAEKTTPPPLVFQPPPPEVFEEIVEEKSKSTPVTASTSSIPSTIPQPSSVAKPVTFDSEYDETVPTVPTISQPPQTPIPASPAAQPFAVKPPVEAAIKSAPVASQGAAQKKTSLLAFMPKTEEAGKVTSTEAGKQKVRRSAIPFLSASKTAPKKGSGFAPFVSGGPAKSGSEVGSQPKFMSVFIPTVDQIKKGQVPVTSSKATGTPFQATSAAPASATPQPPKQVLSPKDAMVVCPNCGHKLSAAYKFCNRCGARVKK